MLEEWTNKGYANTIKCVKHIVGMCVLVSVKHCVGGCRWNVIEIVFMGIHYTQRPSNPTVSNCDKYNCQQMCSNTCSN